MTILFDATKPVKPARKPFGIGLSRELPRRTRPEPTAADMQWWAANSPANRTGYDVIGPADSIIDQTAGEAAALTALEAGYAPF